MQQLVSWIDTRLQRGAEVLVLCVGGLGRSGLVASCLLKARGSSAEEAISEVRRVRSERAVETAVQVQMVEDFAMD